MINYYAPTGSEGSAFAISRGETPKEKLDCINKQMAHIGRSLAGVDFHNKFRIIDVEGRRKYWRGDFITIPIFHTFCLYSDRSHQLYSEFLYKFGESIPLQTEDNDRLSLFHPTTAVPVSNKVPLTREDKIRRKKAIPYHYELAHRPDNAADIFWANGAAISVLVSDFFCRRCREMGLSGLDFETLASST